MWTYKNGRLQISIQSRVSGKCRSRKNMFSASFYPRYVPAGTRSYDWSWFHDKNCRDWRRKIKLQIWDTAGQERFRSITQSYYRSAHALILVYDVSNQPTFDCCPDWLREIEEYASPKVLKVLVGNKIDRDDREIPTEVGDEFSQRHSMYFLETSAKSSDNVERLFTEIAQDLLQQARSRDLPSYTNSSLPPLTDGDGGRDSLTSATSTIIHEKCCSRMAWRAPEKIHFCGNKFISFACFESIQVTIF